MLDTFELWQTCCGAGHRGEFDRREDSRVGDTPRQEQLDLSSTNGSTDAPASPPSEPVQAGLFPDDSVPDELVGYRGPSACQIAGITYRQLDYWARTSLVVPSIRSRFGPAWA